MSRPYVSTSSGGKLHLDTIDYLEIKTEDLAHQLALVNRWTGCTKEPYSVAQHSLWVASIVPQEYRLAALLHDASEAYLNDLSRPVKVEIAKTGSGYDDLETRIMLAVGRAYGLEMGTGAAWWKHPAITLADDAIMLAEARDVLLHTPEWATGEIYPKAHRDTIIPTDWKTTKGNFRTALKAAHAEHERWKSGRGFREQTR